MRIHHTRRCAILLALWCMLASTAAGGTFQFLGGGSANAISADGTTVVGQISGPTGLQAFRWTNATGMVLLPQLPGAEGITAHATAVNANGSVVVGWDSFNPGGAQGFRWTTSGGIAPLPSVQASSTSQPSGVSADGSVVVGSAGFAGPAFRWTAATGSVALTNIGFGSPPFSNTNATGVSADGNVVVGFGSATFNPEAFRTPPNSSLSLTSLGIGASTALGVSGDGNVMFGYTPGASDEAFRWTQAGGKQIIGRPTGAPSNSHALAASCNGSTIVGFVNGSSSDQRAAIWTNATGGMVDLKDVLTAHGIAGLAGVTLFDATGVSADGLTFTSDSSAGGWIATIPEPSTWTLAVLAAAGFAFSLRRRLPRRL